MQELLIKNVINKFISIIFALFLLLATAYFLQNNSIRSDFVFMKNNDLMWLLYITIFTTFALLIIYLSYLLLKKFKIEKKTVSSCAIIVILTIFTRLAWISIFNVIPQNDFKLYYNFATEFAKDNFVGQSYISLFPHTFGYPLILSLLYKLFIPSVYVAQLFNIFLGCGISVTLYFLGRRLFNEMSGLLAALFWIFWPSQIFYSVLVSTEAAFTLLLLLCISLFLSLYANNYRMLLPKHAVLGFLCVFANSIRPLGTILIISFSLVSFLFNIKTKMKFKYFVLKAILPLAVFLISYMLFSNLVSIAISGIINKEVAKSPIGFNLLTGSNKKHDGQWNTEDSQLLSDLMNTGSFNAQEVHNQLMKIGILRYEEQGLRNFDLFLKKFIIMWASDDDILTYTNVGLDTNASSTAIFDYIFRYLRILSNSYYFVMLLLCCIFTFWFIKNKFDPLMMIFLLPILGIVAVHLLMEVHGRYHFPVISLFALLAGTGVCQCMKQLV